MSFPVLNGLEAGPVFTFCSNVIHKDVFHNQYHYKETETNIKEFVDGYLSSSLELYLMINPLKWFEKTENSKIQFGLGTGGGLEAFSRYDIGHIDNGGNLLTKQGLRPNYSARAVISLNMERYMLGVVMGAHSIGDLDDTNSIFGLQLSVKIH